MRFFNILGKKLCRAFAPNEALEPGGPCMSVPARVIERPDPSIYSQRSQLALGNVPTWDNPDITSHSFPLFEPLEAIEVTVRNLSADASALGTQILVEWSECGIDLIRNQLGVVNVDIGRAGFPGDLRTISLPLATPPMLLRQFSLFVTLIHNYDRDRANNNGEQALLSRRTSVVGRAISCDIPVRNSISTQRRVSFFVQPAIWQVQINPPVLIQQPGGIEDIQLTLTVPSTVPTGTEQRFDLYAVDDIELLGGVTLFVTVDN